SAMGTVESCSPPSATGGCSNRIPRALPGTRRIAPACSSASRWYWAARTLENPIPRAISVCDGGIPSTAMRSAMRARMACWVSVRAFISSNTTNDVSPDATPQRIGSAGEFEQAVQGGGHGLATHRLTVAIEMEHHGGRIAAAALPGDPDRADRLVLGAAVRPGDTGDGHGQAGAGMHQRAGHHLDDGLAADRAVGLKGQRLHA